MKSSNLKNYLLLSPVLLLYTIFPLVSGRSLGGDGVRYARYANNLINGFYADPALNPGFLWNGPGLPILLTPFEYFNIPYIYASIINGILIYLTSIFIFIICYDISGKRFFSLIISAFAVVSFPELLVYSANVLTEPLCIFVIAAIALILYKNHNKLNLKANVLITFLLAYLILTKVVFSYIVVALIALLVLFFIVKRSITTGKYLIILIGSIFLCIPYLIYTHGLTGKWFYWADSGGNLLYCSSNPNEIEVGQWIERQPEIFNQNIRENYSNYDPEFVIKLDSILIQKRFHNHDILANSNNLNGVEYDALLKRTAINNIANNKIVFIKNIIYNAGRLFIGTPYYFYFKPPYTPFFRVFNIFKSASFTFVLLISLLLIGYNFRSVPGIIKSFLVLSVVYIAIIIIPANQSQRFLIPIMPVLMIIIGYALHNFIEIKRLKQDLKNSVP